MSSCLFNEFIPMIKKSNINWEYFPIFFFLTNNKLEKVAWTQPWKAKEAAWNGCDPSVELFGPWSSGNFYSNDVGCFAFHLLNEAPLKITKLLSAAVLSDLVSCPTDWPCVNSEIKKKKILVIFSIIIRVSLSFLNTKNDCLTKKKLKLAIYLLMIYY